jgi:hypothetical protein
MLVNTIDFTKMTKDDLKKLSFEDPDVIKQIGLKPLPNMDKITANRIKRLFFKILVCIAVLDTQQRYIINYMTNKIVPPQYNSETDADQTEMNFLTMSHKDLKNISFDNPHIIQQCKLDVLPNLLDLSEEGVRVLLMEKLACIGVLESQRQTIFNKMMELSPST